MFEGPDGNWYYNRRTYEEIQLRNRIMREGWERIPGFENYCVSPSGEVVNMSRLKLMAQRPAAGGRLIVSLTDDDGLQKTVMVGRAVAEAYQKNRPYDGQFYDLEYIDGDVTNNNITNLTWRARWRNHLVEE